VIAASVRAAVRSRGWFGEWLQERDIQVIFASGIVPRDIVHTFPYVARELIPPDAAAGQRRRGGRDHAGANAWVSSCA